MELDFDYGDDDDGTSSPAYDPRTDLQQLLHDVAPMAVPMKHTAEPAKPAEKPKPKEIMPREMLDHTAYVVTNYMTMLREKQAYDSAMSKRRPPFLDKDDYFRDSRLTDIAHHYDHITKMSCEKTAAPVTGKAVVDNEMLRKINNVLKMLLVHEAASLVPETVPLLTVADLGCGKGGDLLKWQKVKRRIKTFVGVDISKEAISEAQSRYQSMCLNLGCAPFDAKFHVLACLFTCRFSTLQVLHCPN